MPIVKKRNEKTEARLLLEDDEPVELPPADIDERAFVLQFETFRPFLPELIETLRAGTIAEPVPVMMDDETFAIHTRTRTFWVKIWHAGGDLTQPVRVHVISCLPLTRGVQVIAEGLSSRVDADDEDDDFDDEDAA
jgi:hypothetical protein